MTTSEIFAKLQPTLQREGVDIEVLRESGENLHVRARRVSPGVPVAFLVKAIAGTLRRYHDTLREVVLDDYDPGEGIGPASRGSSPEFEKVLQHRPPVVAARGNEWMGLDLSGCTRADAVKALENAHRIWSDQGRERFLVRGLGENSAHRAWEKWRHFYGFVRSTHVSVAQAGALVVHLGQECTDPECLATLPIMWMPAQIMVPDSPPVLEES